MGLKQIHAQSRDWTCQRLSTAHLTVWQCLGAAQRHLVGWGVGGPRCVDQRQPSSPILRISAKVRVQGYKAESLTGHCLDSDSESRVGLKNVH